MKLSLEMLWQLSVATAAERQSVQQSDVISLVEEQLKAIDTAVENLRKIFFFEGLHATDFFHSKAREMAFTPEETKLISRVRWDARYGTPSFLWERLVRKSFPISAIEAQNFKKTKGAYVGFVRYKGKKVRRKIVLSGKAIPLQKATDSIATSAFKNEPTWAQIAGETAEEKLRSLRKKAKQVTAIAKHLSVLRNQLKKESEL